MTCKTIHHPPWVRSTSAPVRSRPANCLNACDTPPFILGFYPPGTLQCYTLATACIGLPAGAKIVIIE